MATKPNSYPKVPTKSWARLRARAVAAPSFKMTGDAVSALLGMSGERSATDNVVYPLRRLGIIDDEGALTERGAKWRTDSGYGEACDEILAEIYPDALSHLVDDDGRPDSTAVRTWFDQQGFGASNAGQMASTYVMIASKQIPEVVAPSNVASAASKATAQKAPAKKASATKAPLRKATGEGEGGVPPTPQNGPSLHLDIQIHLPPDATAEQLDRIFESMAKHLYQR